MLYHFFKRFFDIIISLIGVIIVIPLYIAIRLVYMATGVFHNMILAQTRVGKNGKQFKMLKFRTMVINADKKLKEIIKDPKYAKEYSKNHKLDNDPRINNAKYYTSKGKICPL